MLVFVQLLLCVKFYILTVLNFFKPSCTVFFNFFYRSSMLLNLIILREWYKLFPSSTKKNIVMINIYFVDNRNEAYQPYGTSTRYKSSPNFGYTNPRDLWNSIDPLILFRPSQNAIVPCE